MSYGNTFQRMMIAIKRRLAPPLKWAEVNKWFVLAVIALLYLAHAYRYSHQFGAVFLDRWAGTIISAGKLRDEPATEAWRSAPVAR